MHARPLLIASAIAFLVGACSPAPEGGQGASTDASVATPVEPAASSRAIRQEDIDHLNAEGPLPNARAASALEFWLHYKLMKATGMEDALGGEEQAIAAMAAVSLAFERSSLAAQAELPRMVPMFDGTGMDAGVLGVGYGLVGGAMAGGVLNGSLTPDQVAQAIKDGPIKLDGKDGSAELGITQDGLDTTMEQNVNANGVTGKVRTKIHLDSCPDPQGKLVVTIETESNMQAGGASGSVKAKFTYQRWLDDDAHLVDGDDGSAEDIHVNISGTGARGKPLSVDLTQSSPRGAATATAHVSETGHSFFRPDESKHTQKLLDDTVKSMRLIAEMMLQGAFTGGKAPWESGRCVDLQVRSTPEKRKGAQPDTRYTVFAEPRAKKDGMPTGGTVRATLNGPTSLSPQDKVRADAQFDYMNPGQKDQQASITFEARSRRGVGRATLDFDTKKSGYRIVASGDGACSEPITVCDVSKPFTNTVCGGQVTWTHNPTSDRGGEFTFHWKGGKGFADAKGSYVLHGPEEEMTAIYTMGKICGQAAGMTACTAPRTFGSFIWTQIDDCKE
jgi:hypothetical protein